VTRFLPTPQRKVIKPANFADLKALQNRLLGFETRYNSTAKPFDWRYTKTDLNAYLDRLATHETLNPAALTPRRTNADDL